MLDTKRLGSLLWDQFSDAFFEGPENNTESQIRKIFETQSQVEIQVLRARKVLQLFSFDVQMIERLMRLLVSCLKLGFERHSFQRRILFPH
jgi:hypothetical protein